MKKIVVLLMIVFSSLFFCKGENENDDTLLWGALLWLGGQGVVSTDCQNTSGFVICVPPGIGN